eukprot:12722123-Ditylum_brightwellii.AAC.1
MKRYRSTIRRMREERYGREWDGDDNDGREHGLRTKARRLGSFWKIWRNKISKDKKDFVAAHNAKKWHGELKESKGCGRKGNLKARKEGMKKRLQERG